jgi:hypothetical protein
MELLEQPATEKAKEAEDLTCRACYGKYTDARDSGGGSKKNYGLCSRTCRPLPPRAPEGRAQGLRHGPLRPRAQGEPVQGLRLRRYKSSRRLISEIIDRGTLSQCALQ